MAKIFGEPYRNKVFGKEGVARFDTVLREDGYNDYLSAKLRHFVGHPLNRNLRQLAKLYKQDRPILADTEEAEARFKAFFNSATLGIGALILCANPMQQSVLLDQQMISIEKTDDDDDFDTYDVVEAVTEMGNRGYATAELYVPVFERIESSISPQVTNINIARAGFGLPFHFISGVLNSELKIEHKETQRQIEAQADAVAGLSEKDWENELQKLNKYR